MDIFKRYCSIFLVLIMLVSMLPMNVRAEEVAEPVPVTSSDLTKMSDTEYTFSSFGGLKEAAAMTFSERTTFRYIGTSPLEITEDLTLPNMMVLDITSGTAQMKISAGVTLTNGATIDVNTLQIHGTFINDAALFVTNWLEVNGTLQIRGGNVLVRTNCSVTGAANITVVGKNVNIYWYHAPTTAAELFEVAQIAANDTSGWDHSIEFYNNTKKTIALNQPITIPANAKLVLIGDQYGFEVTDILTIDSAKESIIDAPVLVSGQFINNCDFLVVEQKVTFAAKDYYSGTGTLCVRKTAFTNWYEGVSGLPVHIKVKVTEDDLFWFLDDVSGLPALGTPFELKWDNGFMVWETELPDHNHIRVQVHTLNSDGDGYHYDENQSFGKYSVQRQVYAFMDEMPVTGDYQYTLTSLSTTEDYRDSVSVMSGIWNYVKPDVVLGKCENLSFDGKTVSWTAPANSDATTSYGLQLRFARSLEEEPFFISTQHGFKETSRDLESLMQSRVQDFGKGYYSVWIHAESPDFDTVAHGEWNQSNLVYYNGSTFEVIQEEVKTQQYLLDQINKGASEILVDADVTFDQDFKLPSGLKLTIKEGCTLTIPEGIAFEINSPVYVYGNLVNHSDKVYVNWSLRFVDKYTYSGNGAMFVKRANFSGLEYALNGLDMTNFEVSGDPIYWIVRNVEGLPQLGTPTDLTWSNGYMKWTMTSPHNFSAESKVYKVGQSEPVAVFGHGWGGSDSHNFNALMEYTPENGASYYFTVQAISTDSKYRSSKIATSPTWTFIQPSGKLNACTNVSFDGTKLTWTPPAGTDSNTVYTYRLMYASDKDLEKANVRHLNYQWGTLNGTADVKKQNSSFYNNMEVGYYFTEVRAESKDISITYHGPWSMSNLVYFNGSTFEIVKTAKNESWIQEQINQGKTEIALDGDIVLNNDFVLPQNVFVQFNGYTIRVPAGKTLTVRGQLGYWWEQGGLVVDEGGTLMNNGYIGSSGILDIRGSFSGDFLHTAYVLGGMHATIKGISDANIWMHYVVEKGDPQEDHQDLFLEYLDLMNSTDYGHYSFQLHGNLTLPCDLVIPYNCNFFLESQPITLVIPAGRKITNYGDFYAYENQTVENYGTFENLGYMNVQGKWIGNQPVKAKMTQDQLEQAMAAGDHYNLNTEVTLERDMTIDKWFGIQPGAKLVVPQGVKLTVAANLCVMAGGTLDIQGEYELIPPENGHRSIGHYLENGVYSTIKGVATKDMSLNCMVYNTEQLMNAMNLANSTDYGWDFTYVYRDAAFTSNITVSSFIQVTNGATITVPKNVTVTNNYRIEFWEGTTLINEGKIDNNGELIFFGGAKLNNKGNVQVDGVLAVHGSAVNSGTVNCSTNGHLAIEGTWEGNKPVEPIKPTAKNVTRVAGGSRYSTCTAVADELKAILGGGLFDSVVVASGADFPDALAGTYLAAVKKAPILLIADTHIDMMVKYIDKNMADDGTIYILGSENSVSKTAEEALKTVGNVKRLGGKSRFITNLRILEEVNTKTGELLVVYSVAPWDALSVSSSGKPILLVNDKLRDDQKQYLSTTSFDKITIIGSTAGVPDTMEAELSAYCSNIDRVYGKNRFMTSIEVAEYFYGTEKGSIVVACGTNFPDGLCSGALAHAKKAPVILTDAGRESLVADYVTEYNVQSGYVIGSAKVVSDASVRKAFNMRGTDIIK